MQSWTPPTAEQLDQALGILREVDRRFFFSRLKNPLWVAELERRGRFASPPQPVRTGEEVIHLGWPELTYLVAMIPHVPEEAARILAKLPLTENAAVHREILTGALKLQSPALSASLLPQLQHMLRGRIRRFGSDLPELLAHWAKLGGPAHDTALGLLPQILEFQIEPEAGARGRSTGFTGKPRPVSRFEPWEFGQIIVKGVRPLAEQRPVDVTLLLCDALCSFLRKSGYGKPSEPRDRPRDDYSNYWCEAVQGPDEGDDRDDAEVFLVKALTHTGGRAFASEPQRMDEVVGRLRRARWRVTQRILHQLFAEHPETSRVWIQQEIQARSDYGESAHGYEFQRMVRIATERFGETLLPPSNRDAIFAAILEGPPRQESVAGGPIPEDEYQQYRRRFQLKQLAPFQAILVGPARDRFQELSRELEYVPKDEDYFSFRRGEARMIETRSPKSAEELAALSDDELIEYLNTWNSPARHPDGWWIEISHEGLARAFQAAIERTPERFGRWDAQWRRLERNVHLRHAFGAAAALLRAGKLAEPRVWFALGHEILDRAQAAAPADKSKGGEDPGRMVGDFVETCLALAKEEKFSGLEEVYGLLRKLCVLPDSRLEASEEEGQRDPLTQAINSTRGRALEALIDYGMILFRAGRPIDPVTRILEERAGGRPALTAPERSLLASHVMRLAAMDAAWTKSHVDVFFPTDDAAWRRAFTTYLQRVRAYGSTLELLRGEYERAVVKIPHLAEQERQHRHPVDCLGEHLVSFTLWEQIPMNGADSLLERFYRLTDPERWQTLFDHVGRSLRNSKGELPPEIARQAQEFFEWRLAQRNGTELAGFTFWLEAEGLDARWRLEAYLRALEFMAVPPDHLLFEVKMLHELLPKEPDLVVRCFDRLIERASGKQYFHIQKEEAMPILRAGLAAADGQTSVAAQRALEHLLKLGHFEFLDAKK